MANTIQVKRSSANAAPGSLAKGELAWVDHGTGGLGGCLYIGDMTAAGAVVRQIGGTDSSGFITGILTDTALTGTPTAPTAAAGTSTTQLATTAFALNAANSATSAISNASDTDILNPAGGHILIYDGVDTWDNKPITGGDLTINSSGVATVTGVAANTVALGQDTTGPYISTITGTANEIEITGSGAESAAVQIGLPNNVTISGNLTVSGTTTQVDSTVVTVADPIFTLGADAQDSKDRGVVMKYNDGASKIAWMGMDDTDNKFKFIAAATNTSEVLSGTLGDAAFGNIDGTLTTASQTNITGVGTISTGTWNGDIVQPLYGGLGIATNASTGVASVDGGTWTISSEMPTELGGTGLQAIATSGLLVGGGANNDMTVLTIGSAGMKLQVSAAGAPEWTDTMDGGTF